MKLLIKISFLCIFICTLFFEKQAFCFDDKSTHPEITQVGIKYSGINNYLINVLGFTKGTEDKIKPNSLLGVFNNKSILKWLQTGSTEEDSPLCRASTHFHDPNKTWDLSYVTDSPWLIQQWCQNIPPTWNRYSNIYWSTGQTSKTAPLDSLEKQENGWKDAREYFYSALTTSDPINREDKFVKTFAAVGHLMHLLQDMAVPAHVRNDFQSHLDFNGIEGNSIINPLSWFGNEFEYYVKLNGSNLISSATPSIPTGITRVTDLWDTTDVASTTVPSEGSGLAEITSRSFFSAETIPNNKPTPEHTYIQPQIDPLNICLVQLPGMTTQTEYASRKPCNEPREYIAMKSLASSPNKTVYQLDDTVYKANANELIPRAVGYSAAILDYFFRGKLEISLSTQNPSTSTTLRFMVKNATPGEVMAGGKLALVLRYRQLTETANALTAPVADAPYTYQVVELTGQSAPSADLAEYSFPISKLPFWTTDLAAQIVYRGSLGNENDAVAVSPWETLHLYKDINLSLPPSGVYATSNGSAPFGEIRVNAQNNLPGGQTMTDGAVTLYLLYRSAQADPFNSQQVDSVPVTGYNLIKGTSPTIRTIPVGTTTELVFDISATPLPLWATDVYLYVVYQGTVVTGGIPAAATITGMLDISEPTPVDIFNNADKICINGTWHDAGSSAAITLADSNGNGLPDLFDPYRHTISTIFAKASSAPSSASENNFTFSSPVTLAGGDFRRLGYILTDYTFNYSFLENWDNADSADPWGNSEEADLYPGTAIKIQTNSNGSRTWPGMTTIRGQKLWWGAGIVYDNASYPAGTTADDLCGWNNLP